MAETPGSGSGNDPREPEPIDPLAQAPQGEVPPPSMLSPEIEDEIELGDTDIGKNANKALRSLGRAARSFLLYDPGNEAIRNFLQQMHEDFQYFFRHHGQLALAVRPFEMVVGREVVYMERNRERSLAFKLYRDGVRNIVIRPEVDWEEMLGLLKILSVRFVGIRSDEDDIVTLLWKAAFQSIDINAVEGFVPKDEDEDEDEEPGWDTMDFDYENMPTGQQGFNQDGDEEGEQQQGQGGPPPGNALVDRSGQAAEALTDDAKKGKAHKPRSKGRQVDTVSAHALRYSSNAPPHFDLPAPEFLFAGTPTFVDITDEHLEELQREVGSIHLSDHCLELVDELIEIVLDPVDRCELDEILPLLSEIRDFLLSEGQLENLLLMVGLVSRLIDEGGEQCRPAQALLDTMIDKTAMVRLIKSLPRDSMDVPETLTELLDIVEGDHLPILLDVQAELVDSTHGRRIMRLLLEQRAGNTPDRLVARIHEQSGPIAGDLLRILGNRNIETAWRVIDQLAETADENLKNECLHVLERSSYNNTVRGLTFRFLGDPDEDIRLRAIDVLLGHNDRRDFPMLRRHADKSASRRGLSQREATALGEGMARLDANSAMQAFATWTRVKGLRRLANTSNRDLQWAAASGLALIDDPKADDLLHALVKLEDLSIRRHSLRMRMARFNRLRSRTGSQP
jgi:hypothetical protein